MHKEGVILVICSRHSFHWIFFSHLKQERALKYGFSHVLSQNLSVRNTSCMQDIDYISACQISDCEMHTQAPFLFKLWVGNRFRTLIQRARVYMKLEWNILRHEGRGGCRAGHKPWNKVLIITKLVFLRVRILLHTPTTCLRYLELKNLLLNRFPAINEDKIDHSALSKSKQKILRQ